MKSIPIMQYKNADYNISQQSAAVLIDFINSYITSHFVVPRLLIGISSTVLIICLVNQDVIKMEWNYWRAGFCSRSLSINS